MVACDLLKVLKAMRTPGRDDDRLARKVIKPHFFAHITSSYPRQSQHLGDTDNLRLGLRVPLVV